MHSSNILTTVRQSVQLSAVRVRQTRHVRSRCNRQHYTQKSKQTQEYRHRHLVNYAAKVREIDKAIIQRAIITDPLVVRRVRSVSSVCLSVHTIMSERMTDDHSRPLKLLLKYFS